MEGEGEGGAPTLIPFAMKRSHVPIWVINFLRTMLKRLTWFERSTCIGNASCTLLKEPNYCPVDQRKLGNMLIGPQEGEDKWRTRGPESKQAALLWDGSSLQKFTNTHICQHCHNEDWMPAEGGESHFTFCSPWKGPDGRQKPGILELFRSYRNKPFPQQMED